MKRELNETEKRVLETAKVLEQDARRGTWGAVNIQLIGWPLSGDKCRAKKLGISAAILELRRRGFITKHHRHGYSLTPNVQIEGLAATKLGRSPESSKNRRP